MSVEVDGLAMVDGGGRGGGGGQPEVCCISPASLDHKSRDGALEHCENCVITQQRVKVEGSKRLNYPFYDSLFNAKLCYSKLQGGKKKRSPLRIIGLLMS